MGSPFTICDAGVLTFMFLLYPKVIRGLLQGKSFYFKQVVKGGLLCSDSAIQLESTANPKVSWVSMMSISGAYHLRRIS